MEHLTDEQIEKIVNLEIVVKEFEHKPRATYVAFRKLEDAEKWAKDFAKIGVYAVVRRAKRCGSAYRPWEVKVIL